ncbi:hypothetical protein SAMN05421812_114254 [Asanoa hainanensis]|uniref:Uncharacterized protein n=1 Tax=Asanoa hainanensis TaxID=560556 RepID=A0A239P8I7_9ACTN|nr:hypothetical protein [Asanoa hainanensis]SNT63014.1 hypothetical protein SAMN05421812_114254 [Asanoa hainanensis]
MFTLVEKLAEILANYGLRFLDHRRTVRDSDVARRLLDIVVLLQDLCLRGDQLLAQARRFADGVADQATETEFGRLLDEQVITIVDLRDSIVAARALLTSIDAELYLRLSPFLDGKSGLLTRWAQQRKLSTYSTTTLFFLPTAAIDRVAAGSETETEADRADYVRALALTLRETRSVEVRDIRVVGADEAGRLRRDVEDADAELARARELCARMASSVEQAVGAEAMAALRRSLVRDA